MLAKSEIERQLEHFKTACTTDAAETAIWIKALEWVLGDDAHRAAYATWLAAFDMADFPPATPGERVYALLLDAAIIRLR